MQKFYRSRRNLVETAPVYPEKDWGEVLTEQHHENDCDINYLIERSLRLGDPLNGEMDLSKFKDVSETIDLKEALIAVDTVNTMFAELPLKIRKEFDYNPSHLVSFLDNPNNYDRAVELGLVSSTAVDGVPDNTPQQTAVNDTSGTTKTE